MRPCALQLADDPAGQLGALGPGVCSLSVSELASWHKVHIGVRAASTTTSSASRTIWGSTRDGPARGSGGARWRSGRTARSSCPLACTAR